MSAILNIEQLRQQQNNVQTPGSKCNRCFFDIIWDMELAAQNHQNKKPFEPIKSFGQHYCPVDEQGNIITRQGYTKSPEGKVICILPPRPGQSGGPSSTIISTPSTQSSNNQTDIKSVITHIDKLTDAYMQAVNKQNEEIAKLRIIVDEYIRHNPLEKAFFELTKQMLSSGRLRSETELIKPTTADKLSNKQKEEESAEY